MDIIVNRTLYMSCQAGPGIEPGPSALKASALKASALKASALKASALKASALKASALPIELTWQTYIHVYIHAHFIHSYIRVCGIILDFDTPESSFTNGGGMNGIDDFY